MLSYTQQLKQTEVFKMYFVKYFLRWNGYFNEYEYESFNSIEEANDRADYLKEHNYYDVSVGKFSC